MNRRRIVSGIVLVLLAILCSLLGWSDNPNEAMAQAVFVGAVAAIGLALVVVGLESD